MYSLIQLLLEIVSGEFLLTRCKLANGGTVVFLRSSWVAIIIFSIAISLMTLFQTCIDPNIEINCPIAASKIFYLIVSKLSWFGAIFAAIYAALYTRFSSQWMYLSNLYNTIKQTEVRLDWPKEDINEPCSSCGASAMLPTAPNKFLCEWKAGFIEDAESLHMATKPVFVPIIKIWSEIEEVKGCFIKNHPGGKRKFDEIINKVKIVFIQLENK